MKHTVTNEAVHKWAKCLREGLPTKDVFPAKMTDCEFTEAQKVVIRKARSDKKAKVKALKKSKNAPKLEIKVELPIIMPAESKSKPLTKLRKMLYLQQGKCFFVAKRLMKRMRVLSISSQYPAEDCEPKIMRSFVINP